MRYVGAAFVLMTGLSAFSCEREARPYEDIPAATAQKRPPAVLVAGGRIASQQSGTPSPFQENAWGISEGKRFFDLYNCSGCHAHGGGGMGPALMDERWIYGSDAAHIFDTIVEGRPNGMPAFGGRITDAQVWQLVAYVQSMSGHAPVPSLPGRSDHLQGGTPENQRPAQRPVETGSP
jgi:cytochrome c oxidase cbb3-type subunit 3